MLKKTIILLTPLLLSAANWQDTLNSVGNAVGGTTTTPSSTSTSNSKNNDGISQDYASKGLKEALGMGVNQAVSVLGKNNGFLNSSVKIPLPSSLQTVASVAEKAGGKSYVDDFVTTMNTAASKAVPKTAPILSDAIKSMSMADAKSIIAGKNTAATDYFKTKSGDKLLSAIMPIIKETASESKVMSSYKSLTSMAGGSNALSGSMGSAGSLLGQASGAAKSLGMGDALPNQDEDIETYIARKTLDGLFHMIGEKEQALRANPLSSGSKVISDIFK